MAMGTPRDHLPKSITKNHVAALLESIGYHHIILCCDEVQRTRPHFEHLRAHFHA